MFQKVKYSPGNQPFSNLTPFLFFVDCADLTWSEQTRFFCWHRRRPLCLQNWFWQEAFSHHTIVDSSQPWSTLWQSRFTSLRHCQVVSTTTEVLKLCGQIVLWLFIFTSSCFLTSWRLKSLSSLVRIQSQIVCNKVLPICLNIFWAWCQLVALYACLTLSASSSGASRELPQPLLWESPSWGDVNATSNPQI